MAFSDRKNSFHPFSSSPSFSFSSRTLFTSTLQKTFLLVFSSKEVFVFDSLRCGNNSISCASDSFSKSSSLSSEEQTKGKSASFKPSWISCRFRNILLTIAYCVILFCYLAISNGCSKITSTPSPSPLVVCRSEITSSSEAAVGTIS